MMTIGINGNEANVKTRVGIGQYAYELLCHLPKSEVYLSSSPLEDMPKHMEYKVFGPKKLWTLVGLQNKLISEKMHREIPDVFFTPTHYAPLYIPTKSVISIMDMSFEDMPQFFKKRDLYQLRYWTKISALRAKKIITISQFSKGKICKIYGIPPEKVVVTLLGYDSDRFNSKVNFDTKLKNLIRKFALEDGYFVFLGTLQPKKNIERLVEAFKRLERKNIKLVIVGMTDEGRGGWMYKSIFQKVKDFGLEGRVVFTGYLPDGDIPYIFKGSLAYILPSLYEGFGIPVVEAMATGVPVIVSNVGSLPEICGNLPVYINDPYDISCIQAALQQILDMEAGEMLKRVNLGLAWVKRYNWNTTARQTLEVLKNA